MPTASAALKKTMMSGLSTFSPIRKNSVTRATPTIDRVGSTVDQKASDSRVIVPGLSTRASGG